MSLTLKITIPDGELAEHLKGRDSKSRNFELCRLATNDLIRSNQKHFDIPPHSSIERDVYMGSEDQNARYPSPDDGIENNTFKGESSIDASDLPKSSSSPNDDFVNFGDDLLTMG